MKILSKENKTTVGYLIIGFCLVVFCALIVSALALKQEPYDTETFCSEEVSAHTIIILDKTESFSAGHQRSIINQINKEKSDLEMSEKFSVFTLTEDNYINPEPIFSKCNPGVGKNANRLYQNPKMIQIRFDDFFTKPLKENMKNVLSDNSGSRSPIFEMIRELSSRNDFGDNVKKRTLVIISDMMHNMSKYSHYNNKVDYQYFSQKSYAYEIGTNLNSVDVKIVYLLRHRLGSIQGKNHLSFWEEYFEDMGARVVEVRRVR